MVVLVGNKLDKEADREVDYLEGLRWAEENSESSHCDSSLSIVDERLITRFDEIRLAVFGDFLLDGSQCSTAFPLGITVNLVTDGIRHTRP